MFIDRTHAGSPLLDAVRVNPHRLFRLSADLTAEEASWQAGKVVNLLRVGMPVPGEDLVPWLGEADDIDTEAGRRQLEDALHSVTDRLLWFEVGDDANSELLRAALRDPGGASAPWFEVKEDEEIYAAKDGLAELHEAVKLSVNHANSRLLYAAALMAGRVAVPAGTPKEAKWDVAEGVSVLTEPHIKLADSARSQLGLRLWTEGFTRWNRLVKCPAFLDYVGERLRKLDDDTVGDEDEEAVAGAVLARLSDLLVEELRVALVEGRTEDVTMLCRVIAAAGFDRVVLRLSLRRLLPHFEQELKELAGLLTRGGGGLRGLTVYLSRLEALSKRWTAMDPTGVIGLIELVDHGVERAKDALDDVKLDGVAMPELTALWNRAAKITHQASTAERMRDRAVQLERYAAFGRCHFCGARKADTDHYAVIHGKKETGRTRGFNSTTIHYALLRTFIPRCTECMEEHELYLKSGWAAAGWSFAAMVVFTVLFCFTSFGFGAFARAFHNLVGFAMLGCVAVPLIAFFVGREMYASWMTRGGRKGPKDVRETKAWRDQMEQGMGTTVEVGRGAFSAVRTS